MNDNSARFKCIATEVVRFAAVLAALLLAASHSRAAAPKVGAEYEIISSYETSQQMSEGFGSGSSRGRDTFVERVVAVQENGLELEYDLPKGAASEDRARSWQFPVRVFRPQSGPLQMLNQRELEVRADGWLKAAGLTRADCGRWIFTWNAFRIECDPQSVMKTIEALDLIYTDLHDGAPYHEVDARFPGRLGRTAAARGGETFTTVMDVDPDAVRRGRAEADVAVGEIMRKPVTLESRLRERAKESVSGTITVALDLNDAGEVTRRTKVTNLEIINSQGQSESRTARETVERRIIPASSARVNAR